MLLTGLVLAVADWRRRHDRPAGHSADHAVLIDLEGHGREEVFADVDLSRTVGWFTSLFPVRLDPGAIDLDEALAGGAALGRALKAIKEQLRGVPNKGLGYGLLRYLNGATAAQLAGFAAPQIGFNYLGRFAGAQAVDWGAAGEMARFGGGDPAMPLAHGLEINALHARCRRWRNAERDLVVCACALERGFGPRSGGELVPACSGRWCATSRKAMPAAAARATCRWLRSRSSKIERLERRYPRIEDILPLSPLQEGLLFHALYDARAPDVYTVQLELDLAGPLDGAALQAAAQALLTRHGSLRAGFWHREPEPEPDPAGADRRAERLGAVAHDRSGGRSGGAR